MTPRPHKSPIAQELWGRGHLTILAEDGGSVQVVGDAGVLLEGTLHLFPCNELPNLLGQLQKLLPGSQR